MRAGLAESVRGQIAVRPELLRRALVAHSLFTDSHPQSIDEILRSWPNHAEEVGRSAIEAAHLGAPGARAWVLRRMQSRRLPPQDLWAAARIDASLAQAAMDAAPSTSLRAVYEVAARRYALPDAITALLDLGVADDRPRHSHPDHPLRIVSEIGTRLYPHELTSFEARSRVLDTAITWVRRSSTNKKWVAFAEIVASALNPQVEGNWPELQGTSKFTMAAGFESPANLAAIEKQYWPRVAPLLTEMPDQAVSVFADLLDAWIRVARGYQGPFGVTPTEPAKAVAARLVRRMKREFAARASGRAGLTARLQSIGRLLSSPIKVEGPQSPEFALLSRDILGRRDRRVAERSHYKELRSLAESWLVEPPARVVSRLDNWQREAQLAQREIGSAVAFTINQTLELGAPADQWAEAVVRAGLCPAGSPALDSVLELASDVPAWLAPALAGPCRGAVVSSVLSRPPTTVSPKVLTQLDSRDADAVEWAIKRRSAPDETCRLLLRHRDPDVRGAAALGFRVPGRSHGPELPKEWVEDWAAAVSSIEMGRHTVHRDYEVREMLEALVSNDPDIAESWIRRALANAKYAVGTLPYDSDEYLHRLPRAHRDRLLKSVSGSWNRSQMLEVLLGDDVGWAEQLISAGVFSAVDILNALAGRTGPGLERFLPALLAAGVTPKEAASRAHLKRVWVGSESAQYAELRDYFQGLSQAADASLSAVGAAGADLYNAEYERAVREEKAERIRGL